MIVGRSWRRTRAQPALVLCPPRGRSGLRRTLRVPATLPRCWVRTRIAPRPPPLAAHPFPSVHKGRLSRLGWRSSCMLTQLWGCKHPERPRAQGATCRHAFCPARGSCWHWPPGSDCCRAPGRAPGTGGKSQLSSTGGCPLCTPRRSQAAHRQRRASRAPGSAPRAHLPSCYTRSGRPGAAVTPLAHR